MLNYIVRRLLGIIPLLLGITILSFAVIHLAPGKPVNLDTSLNPKVSQEARARLNKIYGLDKPLYLQYIEWLGRLSRFDFGRSFSDNRPVGEKILERMPLTLGINFLSLLFIFALAVPLGIKSAVKKDKPFDKAFTVLAFISFALPTFWIALLLMQLFGISLGLFPISGIKSMDFEYFSLWHKTGDLLWHLALPVFVLSITGVAGMLRYMRSSMIETLAQPYIYTARAKGLPEKKVLYKHALRNAALPLITILGLSIPGLLGGSVIFESIFALPGMGQLFYSAVMMRDYPVIMAEVVLVGVLTMIGNLLADIAYAWLDPRIRYER